MNEARIIVLGLSLIAAPAFSAAAGPSRVPAGFGILTGAGSARLTPIAETALPVPMTVPALPILAAPAVAAEPARAEADPAPAAGAAQPASAEADRAEADAAFDGAGPEAPAVSGPSLVAADPAQAEWLESVLAAARRSKTARRVLADVDALTRARGRPLLIAIGGVASASAAEYAYDHELVTVGRGSLKDAPEAVATLLLHELRHALQFAERLPASSLEIELDAYLTQFRVADELGWKPKRSDFHHAALRRLAAGAERFAAYIGKQYPHTIGLAGSKAADYEAKLEKRRKRLDAALKRTVREIDEKDLVLASMRQTGQTDEAVSRFEQDERAPLLEYGRVKADELRWVERDLAILRDPALRARYRAFSRSVMRRLRRYHASLAGR